MITSAEQYFRELYIIQSENKPQIATIKAPFPEKIYEIDLNTRVIETDSKFLSVEYDHNAEVILFKVDRYFDNVDLSEKCCVIQYINANGQAGIYLVPFYDIISYNKEGKMLIPWSLCGSITAFSGKIQYAVKFYEIHRDSENEPYYYTFNLNTLPAQGIIAHGMYISDSEEFQYEPNVIEEVYARIDEINKTNDFYWLDVTSPLYEE